MAKLIALAASIPAADFLMPVAMVGEGEHRLAADVRRCRDRRRI